MPLGLASHPCFIAGFDFGWMPLTRGSVRLQCPYLYDITRVRSVLAKCAAIKCESANHLHGGNRYPQNTIKGTSIRGLYQYVSTILPVARLDRFLPS